MRIIIIAALLAATAACNSEPAKPVEAEAPATLVPGEYEVVSEVTKLATSDQSTPATKLKMGQKDVIRACVAADGTPDAAMFVEPGDDCTVTSSFARSGRLSVQYSCTRAGKGTLYPNADGNFTADGYKAIVTVGTSFTGPGDYNLTRMLTAKRVGNCQAGGVKSEANAAPAKPS